MAIGDAHKNFAYSTIATAPSPAGSGTSLIVTAADGVKFPAVPFNAVIWPAGAQPIVSNAEIVRVTNISTDTFTITRTQEATSARTVIIGDQIAAAITSKILTDIEAYMTANADGMQVQGGTTPRILKWLGADITITGSGLNEHTFPGISDTLIGMSGYNESPSLNVVISAGFGAYVPDSYEIVDTYSLDIGDGGIFEIS